MIAGPLDSVLLLVSVLVCGAPSDQWRDADLLVRAFSVFMQQSSLAPGKEALVAEMPCGEALCVQFVVPELERDSAIRSLPQLLAGFGYGAGVERLVFRTFPTSHKAASVEVAVRPDVRARGTDEIVPKVEDLLGFLKVVSRLSDRYTEAFHPARIPAGHATYFLNSVFVEQGGDRIAAELLAPPRSPIPGKAKGHWLRKDVALPECRNIEINQSGKVETGLFKGWRRHALVWKHVCAENRNPLQ